MKLNVHLAILEFFNSTFLRQFWSNLEQQIVFSAKKAKKGFHHWLRLGTIIKWPKSKKWSKSIFDFVAKILLLLDQWRRPLKSSSDLWVRPIVGLESTLNSHPRRRLLEDWASEVAQPPSALTAPSQISWRRQNSIFSTKSKQSFEFFVKQCLGFSWMITFYELCLLQLKSSALNDLNVTTLRHNNNSGNFNVNVSGRNNNYAILSIGFQTLTD